MGGSSLCFDEAFPHLCAVAWEELCRQAVPLLHVVDAADVLAELR